MPCATDLRLEFLGKFQPVLRLRRWQNQVILFLHFLQLKSTVLGKITVINEVTKFVKFVLYSPESCKSLQLDNDFRLISILTTG